MISRFGWLLAVAVAGGVVWASPAPPVLEGLMASGPAADIAEKMMLFGRLVGSWDIDYTAYPPGRDSITAKCEWHFGWVLDGRAVQDVWICPPRAARGEDDDPRAARGDGHDARPAGEWGTTIRVYDKKVDAWHVVFIGPVHGNVNTLLAHPAGNGGADIVQEGRDSSGNSFRWNFDRITPASFRWWSEMSSDSGRTWSRQEQMLARRRGRS